MTTASVKATLVEMSDLYSPVMMKNSWFWLAFLLDGCYQEEVGDSRGWCVWQDVSAHRLQ